MTVINSFPINASKLSEKPEATGLIDGSEFLTLIQGGVNKKITGNNFNDIYKKQADVLGLFEYSATSTYVIGSLVRQTGTSNVYKSITNANFGNALTDTTKWQLCGDLTNLLKIPTTYKVVNTEADFGVASGGEIILTNGICYIVNSTTVIANTLVIPAGANIQIVSAALTKAVVYTGVGALFKATSAFGIVVTREVIFQAPNGTIYDILPVAGAGTFYHISSIIANAVAGGTVRCATFTAFFAQFQQIGTGITFENNSSLVSLSHTSSVAFRNVGTNMFTFKGNIPDIAILDSRFVPTSLDTVYDLQPSLETFSTNIVVNSTTGYPSGAGQVFAPTSLKQDYKKAYFAGNVGITDSTVSSQMAFINSALTTDIITVNVRALINATWDTQLQERFLLVDHCTFDNAANTITTRLVDNTTAYNHGLANDQKIKFKTGGTLPPEILPDTLYYIISATATTFQISLTLGGSLIDFSTNGTGTHYLLHKDGLNRASWILYDGITQEKININGSVSGLGLVAGDKVFFASVVKLDSSLAITTELDLFGKGSNTTVDNLIAGSSSLITIAQLLPQESLRFFITNKTDNADLVVQDASITLLKI
jgi:hypothetical protein